MRLIVEICRESELPAIINIHDVVLAQQFADRIIGLQAGRVVFDGPPAGLTEDVLTRIYGEEDWTAMRKGASEDAEAEEEERAQAKAMMRSL
jgi:phosphonate transport system ATP-binding protein